MGPFERDAHRLGRILGKEGVDVTSPKNKRAMKDQLTILIDDTDHIVRRLGKTGAPDINGGQRLASMIVATFRQIGGDYVLWRSVLPAGERAWLTGSRVQREHLRAALQAFILIGHQIELLPRSQERQNAMARSPVCRDEFGSVRADQKTDHAGAT